jgi:hypothetical protein
MIELSSEDIADSGDFLSEEDREQRQQWDVALLISPTRPDDLISRFVDLQPH